MTQPGPLHVVGMYGLGDNVYQRPFIRQLASRHRLWLTTPWPELYADLPVRFVHRPTTLRTQRKNMARQDARIWSAAPRGASSIMLRYGPRELAQRGIVGALEAQVPGADGSYRMDLPDFGPCPIEAPGPIALVRPVTRRAEWESQARNPEPRYLQAAIELLKARGWFVVSVADCEDGSEWFEGPAPHGMDLALHRGELDCRSLLALVQASGLLLGGVGWIAPLAVAAAKPLFLIFGGRGGHNGPQVIFDRRMDLSRIGYAKPDAFCGCVLPLHSCDKTISGFAARLGAWLDGLSEARTRAA